MPKRLTRITRTRSRWTFLGGRVTTTKSWTVENRRRSTVQAPFGAPWSTQVPQMQAGSEIHRPTIPPQPTPQELLEMQRIHRDTAERLRADFAQEKAAHIARLDGAILWLYRQPFAGIALGSYALLTLMMIVLAGTISTVGGLMEMLLLAATLALAIMDWRGLSTFGQRVNWPLFRLNHPKLYPWVVGASALYFMVPTFAYLIYCVQSVPILAQLQRQRLHDDIARLEQELYPHPLQTGEH